MSKSKTVAGKHGVPVLVCLGAEPLSLSCSLRIQHHEPRKQVTLMLRTRVALEDDHDDDDANAQAFVLQYDAQNLLPETASALLNSPEMPVDAPRLDIAKARLSELVRNPSSSQLTVLSLRLKQPCPLWCPHRDDLVPKPTPRHVAIFNELVLLAKATTLHIVFDYHWLSLDHRVPFQRIVTGKIELTGFPVADYYSRFYRRADWTVFGPAESLKRKVASPPSSLPPYKRKAAGGEQPAASPTDVATSPAASYKCGSSPKPGDEHDFQTSAITSVVLRHLPAILTDILPTVLPTILPALFALPASFSSSLVSDTSTSSSPLTKSQSLPQPHLSAHDLTPLGASLLPHILAHLAPQLSKLHNASIRKWTDRTAQELEETADDYTAHLTAVTDEGVAQLAREVGYQLDEVRQVGVDVAENVGEEVEDVIRARGDRAVREVRRAIREAVDQRRDDEVRCVKGGRRGRGARHLGKGGYRSVGCRYRS